MAAGGFIAIAVMAAAANFFMIGHAVGVTQTEKRYANTIKLGEWLAEAISGVRNCHRFTGGEITAKSKGRAKTASGETFVVSVEKERP